jgi:uncharacterized membrane protein YdjX (TVP38/TMEM64 family)
VDGGQRGGMAIGRGGATARYGSGRCLGPRRSDAGKGSPAYYHGGMPRAARLLPLLVLAVIAVALLLWGLPDRLRPESLLDNASDFLGLASSRPVTTFMLLCALIALVTAVGLPGAVAVFAAAGFLLGVPAAMAAAALGNVLGTSVLFAALRTAMVRPGAAPAPDAGTVERLRAGFQRHPLPYALFLRAMPVLPNGIATATLAALHCRWPAFLTASALGPQANAALMAWLGAQLAFDVRAGQGLDAAKFGDPRWWLPLLLLALLMLVPVLLRRREPAPSRQAVKVPGTSL